jgi:hypothetical protein
VERYPSIREEFYQILRWALEATPNTIARAPELHGSDLLRGETDERKLEVLGGVVDLAVTNGLRMYRVGYFITDEIRRTFAHDPGLLGTCWLSLRSMMEPLLESEAVIPVMDGFDPRTVQLFSQSVKHTDELRAIEKENWLSLRHTHNLIGEVFYADSRYSVMVQVADVLSYLRSTPDLVKFGFSMSPFKTALASLSSSLEECIAWEEIISLILNGEIQGPIAGAHPPFRSYGPLTRAFKIVASDTEDLAFPRDPWA